MGQKPQVWFVHRLLTSLVAFTLPGTAARQQLGGLEVLMDGRQLVSAAVPQRFIVPLLFLKSSAQHMGTKAGDGARSR